MYKIEHFQKIAENRKGKCLSEIYINIKEKLLWECSEGHQWWAEAGSVKYGSWCPFCARILGTKRIIEWGKNNRKKEDLTGKTYGNWTVMHFIERKNNVYYWMCRCLCGNTKKAVTGNSLKNGTSKSCGKCPKISYCEKHNMKRTRLPSGSYYCKKCRKEYAQLKYQPKEKFYKNCVICDEIFPTFMQRQLVCSGNCSKEYKRKSIAEKRKENPEKYKDINKRSYKKNFKKNRIKNQLRVNKYRENPENKDKIRKSKAIDRKRAIDNLSDRYIKTLFRGKSKILNASDIPNELIELKRLHLTLQREARRAYGTNKKH